MKHIYRFGKQGRLLMITAALCAAVLILLMATSSAFAHLGIDVLPGAGVILGTCDCTGGYPLAMHQWVIQ